MFSFSFFFSHLSKPLSRSTPSMAAGGAQTPAKVSSRSSSRSSPTSTSSARQKKFHRHFSQVVASLNDTTPIFYNNHGKARWELEENVQMLRGGCSLPNCNRDLTGIHYRVAILTSSSSGGRFVLTSPDVGYKRVRQCAPRRLRAI